VLKPPRRAGPAPRRSAPRRSTPTRPSERPTPSTSANPDAVGDPGASGSASLEVVDADEPPLRVFFGTTPLDLIRDEYAGRIETRGQWSDLSRQAHGHAA
jgi:hypothetical protein